MIFLELVDRRGRPSMAGLNHPTHAPPAPMPSALPMAVAQTGSRATSILSACRDRLGIHDRGRSNQLRPPDLRPNSGLEREPNYRRRIGPARDGGRHHAGLVALSSVVVVVFVHTMSVDGDTAVHAAAKQLADRRRSAPLRCWRLRQESWCREAWSIYSERRSGCAWSRLRPSASRT